MERTERIELLNKVAVTVNHDRRGKFVDGETDRIDQIEKILDGRGYHVMKKDLFVLCYKVPVDEIEEPVTVISSHVDTHEGITNPFSELIDNKKLWGTYDNSITNAGVLTLMLEGRLPDSVIVAFTGNEEHGMRGASDFARYLTEAGIQARVIVTDVTPRGYKEKKAVIIENRCRSGIWTNSILMDLFNSEFSWGMKGNHQDDETAVYDEKGLECFSLCIPTKGEMHDNSGLKARAGAYDEYIEALCIAACA